MSVEKVDRIPLTELSGAIIDGAYRYSLWRTLRAVDHPRRLLFIMLNPSTADAQHNDPTLRRCLGFASSWGYDSLEVCNLFAYRATNPEILRGVADPVGPANDEYIGRAVARASLVVAAWGARGGFMNRAVEMSALITRSSPLSCLGLTKQGFPRHPLYVRGTVDAELFAKERRELLKITPGKR